MGVRKTMKNLSEEKVGSAVDKVFGVETQVAEKKPGKVRSAMSAVGSGAAMAAGMGMRRMPQLPDESGVAGVEYEPEP